MLKKNRYLPSVLWCTLAANGCIPQPPDVPVCESLTKRLKKDSATGHVILSPSPTCEVEIEEPECGHCVYIVSGREIYLGNKEGHTLGGKTWADIQAEAVLLPAQESYAPLATYIINSCEKEGCSMYAQKFKAKLSPLGK
jgi:hypothetical protein